MLRVIASADSALITVEKSLFSTIPGAGSEALPGATREVFASHPAAADAVSAMAASTTAAHDRAALQPEPGLLRVYTVQVGATHVYTWEVTAPSGTVHALRTPDRPLALPMPHGPTHPMFADAPWELRLIALADAGAARARMELLLADVVVPDASSDDANMMWGRQFLIAGGVSAPARPCEFRRFLARLPVAVRRW